MPKKRFRRWMTAFLAAVLVFGAADLVLWRIVDSAHSHRLLVSRLEQAFGRKVEVGHFGLQWFPAFGIVARQVSIGEDPRFGNEYFLRAQSVVAMPRWSALLMGRLELGTLQFSQPSLNLVRNPDGRWNVEGWLPPSAASPGLAGNASARAPRSPSPLFRIVIDGGRINFNQGVDRRPFALVDVAGSIGQDSPGVWNIDLSAHPQRASVRLQDSGTLWLAGHIAGTSARLHPAELTFTWSDASLADALRLALGRDPGVRGELQLQLQLTARSEQISPVALPAPAKWSFSFSAGVAGLHRWDMPSRENDPTASIQAEASWSADAAQVELTKLLVQAPQSSIGGTGSVDWSQGIQPELSLNSSGVALDDLFSWYRSFQPGVADSVAASGFLEGKAELHGWPIRVDSADVWSRKLAFNTADGPLFQVAGFTASAEQDAGVVRGAFWFPPGSSPPPPGFLSGGTYKTIPGLAHEWLGVSGAFGKQDFDKSAPDKLPGRHFRLDLNVASEHAERILAASRALGRPINLNWDARGSVDAHLHWQWRAGDKFPRPTGDMAVQAVTLQLPVFNQPLEIARAKLEMKPGERRVTIAEASGLGARWEGTIARRDEEIPTAHSLKTSRPVKGAATPAGDPSEWEFDLAADRLDAEELDRWVGPRSRPGWLARLFTQSGAARPQILTMAPVGQLHARGTLRVDKFAIAPLDFQKLNAQVELLGRSLDVSQFDAMGYGGSITGKLLASLAGDPTYWMRATVNGVSAAELTVASPVLEGRIAGQLSGEFRISMHGIGRENLVDSLEGDGRVSAGQVEIRGVDFSNITDDSPQPAARQLFPLISAEFSVAARQFKFTRIGLLEGKDYFEGSGTTDFGRALHFDIARRPVGVGISKADKRGSDRMIRITGLLEAPDVSSEMAASNAAQPAPQTTQSTQTTTRPINQNAPPATRTSSTGTSSTPSQPRTPVARH